MKIAKQRAILVGWNFETLRVFFFYDTGTYLCISYFYFFFFSIIFPLPPPRVSLFLFFSFSLLEPLFYFYWVLSQYLWLLSFKPSKLAYKINHQLCWGLNRYMYSYNQCYKYIFRLNAMVRFSTILSIWWCVSRECLRKY